MILPTITIAITAVVNQTSQKVLVDEHRCITVSVASSNLKVPLIVLPIQRIYKIINPIHQFKSELNKLIIKYHTTIEKDGVNA